MSFRDPSLLHPIPVKIAIRRQDETLWDTDAREPIGNVATDPVVPLVAQVSWKTADTISDIQGNVERMDGYLLFLRKDLISKGVMVDAGDRIVSIGEGDGEVLMSSWVWRIQRRGHYPNQGGWTILKAWFKDKKPVLHR